MDHCLTFLGINNVVQYVPANIIATWAKARPEIGDYTELILTTGQYFKVKDTPDSIERKYNKYLDSLHRFMLKSRKDIDDEDNLSNQFK